MALLRPKSERKKSPRMLRPYTTLRCPFNGHQVSWCRELCEPIGEYGHCGRIATHRMIGRTQAAIASYRDRPLKTRS
jgi:hypothetical protein